MSSMALPKTMLAWQKHLPSKILVRVEVPIPSPKANEILVKLHAVGVCHSDYAVKEMEVLPPEFPAGATRFTMGHEGCGEIISCGPGATRFKIGEVVALICVPGCYSTTCPECSEGNPQICTTSPRYGAGNDGYFAPYVTVQENAAVKVPEGVSASVAAISTDALMTSHHAVTGRARVVREDTVLLLGLGGLGFNALQMILHIGARVIVTDKRQIVLDEAEKFGVRREDIIPADVTDISEWTRQRGLKIDKAIDFVSMPETFKAAIDSVRRAGTVVTIGLLGPELTFRTATIVRKQLNILGSYGGTEADVKACLKLCAEGVLKPQVSQGSLADFPTILEDLHNGKFKGRMTMIPEREN